MNRIESIFRDLRAAGRRGLMPFVCGGHPFPRATAAVLPRLQAAGASIVEVGIPFSDPIADGPVIAAAMHEAIRPAGAGGCGATPMSVFDEVASVRGSLSIGLVAMCSVSIVYRMGGPAGFIQQARAAGFDGVIVPDMPLEESGDLAAAAKALGVCLSLLVAPTTPPARAAEIARASSGFVYLLARSGITGERSEAPQVEGAVAALRKATDLPIACGFGIGTADHVRAVVRHADAAIVGSALVRRMTETHRAGSDAVAAAAALVAELAGGLPAPPR